MNTKALLIAIIFSAIILIIYFTYIRINLGSMPAENIFLPVLDCDSIKSATFPINNDKINNVLIPSLSIAYDCDCKPCKNKSGIHLITNFFPVIHPRWRAGIGMEDAKSEAQKREWIDHRQQELEDVLQEKLNYHLIAAVYVLYSHPYVLVILTKLNFKNKNKLVLHKVDKDPTYRHALDYANAYLMGRFVVFANQDIYLGEGWDMLDPVKMGDNKIMYALTRHGRQERYCKMSSTCDVKVGYHGSQDTFAFVLRNKLTDEGLKELDHQSDNYGMENILIWVFQKNFKFKVLNPCFKIRTYHVHCQNTHNKLRPRVNHGENTGSVGFSDDLE